MQLSKNVEVGAGVHGRSIVCRRSVPAGEVLFRLTGTRVTEPSKYTIQRGPSDHIAPDGDAWALINHACDPNCRIDFANWEVVTRRPIPAGVEISFNYLSTEWDLATPFACACGAPACVGMIRGFRHLSEPQREALRPMLSPYLETHQLVAGPAWTAA